MAGTVIGSSGAGGEFKVNKSLSQGRVHGHRGVMHQRRAIRLTGGGIAYRFGLLVRYPGDAALAVSKETYLGIRQMAKAPKDTFELPNELRSMAENSMAQARQAFDGFMGAAQNAVSKMEERATAAHTGAKAANERIITFAQQNIAASFDYAERLVKAKNISEIMAIHADFARSQMQALTDQSKALGQVASEAARGAKRLPK